jgi:hypothetical protein
VQKILSESTGLNIGFKLQRSGEILLDIPPPTAPANPALRALRAGATGNTSLVVNFDPVIESVPANIPVGLNVTPEGQFSVVFPNNTAQKIRPALLQPATFRTLLITLGASKVLFPGDGSSRVVFSPDLSFQIKPSLQVNRKNLAVGQRIKPKISIVKTTPLPNGLLKIEAKYLVQQGQLSLEMNLEALQEPPKP